MLLLINIKMIINIKNKMVLVQFIYKMNIYIYNNYVNYNLTYG